MKRGAKSAVYDKELKIEAFRFRGLAQPFPNHFHEYYVIGLVEEGERCLSCKNQEFIIKPGNMVLFNPGDSHGCVQYDSGGMDYRGINISKEVMLELAEEACGSRELPGFSCSVISDGEAACYMQTLHNLMMEGSHEFEKEENLFLLILLLTGRYGKPFKSCIPECREEIEQACMFMEQHYAERIRLEQICGYAGLSKSTLLRAFTASKGVTPYSYLENVRIGKAKKLLEYGVSPVETALQTGFSDQSHFTNYFTRFIGLAPGAYQEIFMSGGRTRRKEAYHGCTE